MSFTITLGFLALCALLLAGFIISLLGIAFARFALNAKAWDGFITIDKWLELCFVLRPFETLSVDHLDERFVLKPFKGGYAFISGLSYKRGAEIRGGRFAEGWHVEGRYSHNITKFNTIEDALTVEHTNTYTEMRFNDNFILLIPALFLALLADLTWWLLGLYPILTVSVCSTIALTLCTRWLSGKLATTVKQTKENTDDIKVLKNADKQ